MNLTKYDVIIIGCGLSGIVIAEQFSSNLNKKVLIVDKRPHIGGNCYDYIDPQTDILINKYGAHLFHTNDEQVFKYINKFGKWLPWEHKVLGLIDGKYLSIPPNISTVNAIFNLKIKNKKEMDTWLADNQVKYDKITNGEEMAKSRVGKVLYEKIFKHYTYKQWNKYPDELAPEVLARIPVKNSFDDRYFSDKYQVLPEKGYTHFFQSILDKHKHNIDVKLNVDFFDIKDQITKTQIVIYTGPIDAYFADKGLPALEYRSIDFHIERKMNTDYYQPYSVVNFPGKENPYTRCVEYKHFLNQKSDHTIYVKETTTDKGEPYYPVLNDRNIKLYAQYHKMAEEEGDNIHFIGRLASYKYFNMDQAIRNSLDYYNEHFNKIGFSLKELSDTETDNNIKIFCNKRKRVWFKDTTLCSKLIKNPNTYIIYTKNGQQKTLAGVDYVGSYLLDKPCLSIEHAKNIGNNTVFYYYIRGHIRNSFKTNKLLNLVKVLKSYFPNIIFVLQTWNRRECKNGDSWRHTHRKKDDIILKLTIDNYFKDINITNNCLILDEETIELVGSTNGHIVLAPKKGWKNMWYGIYKGIEHLKSDNQILVSTRYDYFDVSHSHGDDNNKILHFIEKNLNTTNIKFIRTGLGCDNFYIGRVHQIKNLTENFHLKLDDITKIHPHVHGQEILVTIIATQYNDN